MALLELQDASAGLDAVNQTAASAGGDTMPGGSRAAGWGLTVALVVNNSDTVAHTVTVAGGGEIVVPAGSIGILPVHRGQFGVVRDITYDAVTSLFVAAVLLSPVD